MGNIAESCIKCTKKEDEDFHIQNDPNKIQTVIGDKYCKGKMAISKDTIKNLIKSVRKTVKSSILLFTNIFYKDPMKYYKIESELSPNKKKVTFIKDSNLIRLMIIIDRKDIMDNEQKKKYFLEDIKSLQLLDHPNINKIYEVYLFDNNYYLICNYIEQHNIVEIIKNCRLDEESNIKIIMNQLLNSIVFLHENGIFDIGLNLDEIIIIQISLKTVKRQLKRGKKTLDDKNNNTEKKEIENELIKKRYELKLSALGYLNENYEDSNLDYIVFYPPEIIEQIEKNELTKIIDNEDDKTDEWACGIIMYYLICGEFPFKGEKDELFSNIKNASPDFSSEKFKLVSDSCVDLISKLLEKDKDKRIKSTDFFNHPFFTGENIITTNTEKKEEEIDVELLKNLLTLKKPRTKFHELINAYLCFNFIDENEERSLSILFKYIDQDHNNVISEDDIKNAFKKNNIVYTDEDIKNILYVFDYDQNNLIQYQEFLRVLCDKEDLFKEENLKRVFDAIDTDNNQYINGKDFQEFIPNDEGTKQKIEKEFMEPFGMKGDDKMIYDQFCEIIKKGKIYSEVNNFISRIKKIKQLKENLTLEKNEKENE